MAGDVRITFVCAREPHEVTGTRLACFGRGAGADLLIQSNEAMA